MEKIESDSAGRYTFKKKKKKTRIRGQNLQQGKFQLTIRKNKSQ